MRFIWSKITHLLLVVLAVTMLTFVMTDRLPADIAAEIAGHGASAAELAEVRERLGLNRPVLLRYATWIGGVCRGEFGKSLITEQPVSTALRSHLPVTLELLALSQLFALLLALPAGIISAWRSGSPLDRVTGTFAFGCASLPNYALAMGLVFLFALKLKLLPATGYTPLNAGIGANLKGFLLPALSIALVEWVTLMRVLRSDLIATLKEDFILLARCKGLPTWRILLVHALRPSCITFITVLGMQTASLIGGAVIIETVFALPGIGRLLVTAIFAQDFPVIQGGVLLITVSYVCINFLVDLCYAALDPRVRTGVTDG
ncbi:MAG: peptide ABC transporter [Desulfuromonadaceae bacterium GWB2_53_15]|nr:MAG: peptide ABC transporter [Nitrospirae bacterium GWD2_57_9]OHB29073.1 MAG: peptide ABC transporter [Desulfuromonadaceae bacterium GWB2_53_15]